MSYMERCSKEDGRITDTVIIINSYKIAISFSNFLSSIRFQEAISIGAIILAEDEISRLICTKLCLLHYTSSISTTTITRRNVFYALDHVYSVLKYLLPYNLCSVFTQRVINSLYSHYTTSA